jgi:hypothetical protein
MQVRRYQPTLAQGSNGTSTGPRWVPLPSKTDWGFLAGVATVAAVAAALVFIKK